MTRRRYERAAPPMSTDLGQLSGESAAQWLRHQPRALRTLAALLEGRQTRERIDRVSGSSNGPNLIGRLQRRLGIEISCVMEPTVDWDGLPTMRGVYELTPSSAQKVRELIDAVLDGPISSEDPALPPFGIKCTAYLTDEALQRAVRRWLQRDGGEPGAPERVATLLRDFGATRIGQIPGHLRERFFAHLISRSRPKSLASRRAE